jgi:hypothetical protein
VDRNIDHVKAVAKTWQDRAMLAPEAERGEAALAAMTITLVWWINQVRPGGDWDYKGRGPEFEEFGNFNFGATAQALEIPYYIGGSGGGVVVVNLSSNVVTRVERLFRKFVAGDQTPLPKWWSEGIPFLKWPYGDDPKDARQAHAGYGFYEAKQKGECK